MVERAAHNGLVVGSIPAGPTSFCVASIALRKELDQTGLFLLYGIV